MESELKKINSIFKFVLIYFKFEYIQNIEKKIVTFLENIILCNRLWKLK